MGVFIPVFRIQCYLQSAKRTYLKAKKKELIEENKLTKEMKKITLKELFNIILNARLKLMTPFRINVNLLDY